MIIRLQSQKLVLSGQDQSANRSFAVMAEAKAKADGVKLTSKASGQDPCRIQ
jgi:hypothetical protein